MWRATSFVFKDLLHHGRFRSQNICGVFSLKQCDFAWSFQKRVGFSAAGDDDIDDEVSEDVIGISFNEAKWLMRLVNVEALKTKLKSEGKEAIPYDDLLDACESFGVARSKEEAAAFARVLHESGFIILFRNKVLLHPERVVSLVRKAVQLAVPPDDDDHVWKELKNMHEKKNEIDILAHKHVRRILWGGHALIISQMSIFFRMTFWDSSWTVVGPLAYFTTATCIAISYAYFLVTSRVPSYRDLMKTLFLRKQKKLIKKHKFDVARYMDLQRKYDTSLHGSGTLTKESYGMKAELDSALHTD